MFQGCKTRTSLPVDIYFFPKAEEVSSSRACSEIYVIAQEESRVFVQNSANPSACTNTQAIRVPAPMPPAFCSQVF